MVTTLTTTAPTQPIERSTVRARPAGFVTDVLAVAGRALRAVPGQGPGTGVANLFMLAGDTDLIKFDRMVKRFLERVLDRRVNARDAQALLSEVATRRGTTAGDVDYAIWEYESGS